MAETEDIEVLREMVRLAENRRTEMFESLERVNKYNLALIAFSATFLSVLVTASFELFIIQSAGALLIVSIFLSLFAIRPKTIHSAALKIDKDVEQIKKGQHVHLKEFLLVTAELTDNAATNINKRALEKKIFTICSALSLAFALTITYILYAYA